MSATVRAHVLVKGRVQGVAYRAFTYHEATRQGLNGWVRNLYDGQVEVEVEGDRATIESFIGLLKKGPPLARVDGTYVDWLEATGEAVGFQIVG